MSLGFLMACAPLTPISEASLEELGEPLASQVALGRSLFFDAGLSGAGDISCASCHQPEYFGAEPRETSLGTGGAVVSRNAPSVFNAALKDLQFWDGRADSLEAQVLGPLFAEHEMGATAEGVTAYLSAAWEPEFVDAFPGEPGPTVDQLTIAIAAYERVLPAPSRFDRYLRGDRAALTALEVRGLRAFRNDCSFCHGGDGVGGDLLRVLGDDEPWPSDRRHDRGRYEVTGDPADDMVFVVPSLRNVSQTAPYFHDGSVPTLEEAVTLMGRHQLGETLSDARVEELVAFLGALDAESIPPWAYPPNAP